MIFVFCGLSSAFFSRHRSKVKSPSVLFKYLYSETVVFGDRPPEIYINATKKGNNWLVTVKDNGIGIEPKYSDKIFQMFQRLHHSSEYEGTGIGLAICHKIVTNHGGKIWVESNLGEGATFCFTLPG